jgi:hypothetical protein
MHIPYKFIACGSILMIGALPVVFPLCVSPVRRILICGDWKQVCYAAQSVGFAVAKAAKRTVSMLSFVEKPGPENDLDESILLKSALDVIFTRYPDDLGNDHFNNSLCSVLVLPRDNSGLNTVSVNKAYHYTVLSQHLVCHLQRRSLLAAG